MEFHMASRTPKSPDTTTASPTASITPEALKALFDSMAELKATVAKYQAEATAALAKPAKMSVAGKSEQSIKNDLSAVRAFRKAGFGTLVPHTDIMTFNKWIELGFRPKEGTKAVKVQNLRLFCKAQCRPITTADKKAIAEQKAKHEGRKGKVIPIGTGAQQ
jgi:hypothetical protein